MNYISISKSYLTNWNIVIQYYQVSNLFRRRTRGLGIGIGGGYNCRLDVAKNGPVHTMNRMRNPIHPTTTVGCLTSKYILHILTRFLRCQRTTTRCWCLRPRTRRRTRGLRTKNWCQRSTTRCWSGSKRTETCRSCSNIIHAYSQ